LASRPSAAPARKSSLLSVLLVGTGFWFGFPTVVAYQDMASYVSGVGAPDARWGAVIEKAVAGSTHAAELPFVDTSVTGSISGAGLTLDGVGEVAFRAKNGTVGEVPDEERVNRSEKRGRLVNVAPVQPPKSFNAGSVFKRTSMLLRPGVADEEIAMAFDKPAILGKEIEIAAAFHQRVDRAPDPGVPVMLASLVNNDRPDVLATAYAPPEPD
jgi:hypothetical protein